MYTCSYILKTIIICNECNWFVGNPTDTDPDCPNCGKLYKETKSNIEDVVEVQNGKIVTENNSKI